MTTFTAALVVSQNESQFSARGLRNSLVKFVATLMRSLGTWAA